MSVNPKSDLEQIKTKFASFRAGRAGKERLPEELWALAIGLLAHYPLMVVCRELRLKPEYLKQRAEAAQQGKTDKFKFQQSVQKLGTRPKSHQQFLSLTASDLTCAASTLQTGSLTSECRVMIERTDGGRLTITMPMDWSRIEALCANFLRG